MNDLSFVGWDSIVSYYVVLFLPGVLFGIGNFQENYDMGVVIFFIIAWIVYVIPLLYFKEWIVLRFDLLWNGVRKV